MIKIDIKKNLFTSDGEIELKADFKIKRGEFIAVSGRSGSGKSTLLRVIAGLESSFGKIEVFGKVWQDENSFLPPQKRGIGFVFQDYALFSNMTVLQNLLYVKDDKNLAKHLLEITELYSLKDRYPHTLSGGQKQRVALARALMNRPKLLLLDEPLSAIDEELRESLQKEILALHEEFGTTTILVSHSKKEIESLCDRVLVIRDGVVV
jgi:molybdate transport system ATP-binding protein